MILRRLLDILWLVIFWGSGLIIAFMLIGIFGYLLVRGGPALSLEFVTSAPAGFPLGTSGGVFPAIKGTAYLVLIAVVSSSVPGIITAIYLAEYRGHSKIAGFINGTVQCMAGIPSTVVGLFGYAVFVVYMGFGISLLAGGLSLGIMVFPVIVNYRQRSSAGCKSTIPPGRNRSWRIPLVHAYKNHFSPGCSSHFRRCAAGYGLRCRGHSPDYGHCSSYFCQFLGGLIGTCHGFTLPYYTFCSVITCQLKKLTAPPFCWCSYWWR